MTQESTLRRYDEGTRDTGAEGNASIVVVLLGNSSSRDQGDGDDLYERIHKLPLFVVLVSGLLGIIILATVGK